MTAKRIIPCLDIKDGKVVKGVNFEGLREISDPIELGEYYSEAGADELVFYDITATNEQRKLFTDLLKQVAARIFIPLTVGGGISSIDDFSRVLECGADKVSINSGAIANPELIKQAARLYGSQCVVLSIDAKRVDSHFSVFSNGGRKDTGIDLCDWVRRGLDYGIGEIVLNSIDADGTKRGFDIEMLRRVCEISSVPVIASGGAGKNADFVTLFKSVPDVDAALAASIFHSKETRISQLKRRLRANGIDVRIQE